MQSNSPQGALNAVDWKKGIMVLVYYVLGAVIAFVGTYVLTIDLGVYTLLIGQILGFGIHMAKKWINDYATTNQLPVPPLQGNSDHSVQ